MTTFTAFLPAIAVTLAAMLYLLATDAKRRRVFGLGPAPAIPRSRAAGWTVALAPGLVLLFAGQVSAFLIWCGATTVASWLIVARTPRSG